MILPTPAAAVLLPFAPAFTAPTFERFVLLAVAALLTTGRRTVANLLRTLGGLAPGHRTSYQRVLSGARWSGLVLACQLCRLVLRWLPADRPVLLVGDDTVDGHKGKRVYGKARHRDPVRSTHSYTAWRYGHKWVVLAVLVHFPFAKRPWALPVLVALYRSEEDDRRRGRPHCTPAQLLCRLLAVLLHRFPERRFVLAGDSGYGTHEVARFCHARRERLTLISKLHPEANLYEPPPPYRGKGRPRVKGAALPKPNAAAAAARLRRAVVRWYGGGTRVVALASGTGHWYKSGRGLVPLRWVFVRDLSGTHRDEFFYSTDPSLSPEAVVGHYAWRWNIETTFQELRSHLGLETTRGWCRRTVLRAAPCLFGLYAVVALLFAALPEAKRSGGVCWPGKAVVTFSDALAAVRRWLWAEWVFPQAGGGTAVEKLPEPLKDLVFSALAPAA
jgi:DDE superfamily endonuclease